LRARDSGVFEDLKCLFSTTPKVGKETEANGGHRGDRTRSRYDRTRPVSTTQQSGVRVLGFATGASGHSRDRRVRSGVQRELRFARTIGRVRSLRELTGLQPDAGTVASDRCLERVRSLLRGRAVLCDRRARSFERRIRSFDGRVRSLPGARPVVGLTVGAQ
jgi:hypothetical protein